MALWERSPSFSTLDCMLGLLGRYVTIGRKPVCRGTFGRKGRCGAKTVGRWVRLKEVIPNFGRDSECLFHWGAVTNDLMGRFLTH